MQERKERRKETEKQKDEKKRVYHKQTVACSTTHKVWCMVHGV